MSYTRAASLSGSCCSACAKGTSSSMGDVEATLTRAHLDQSSGFLDQINRYVRGGGAFIARVNGNPADAKTTIAFQKLTRSPLAIGAVAVAVAAGYFIGRRK